MLLWPDIMYYVIEFVAQCDPLNGGPWPLWGVVNGLILANFGLLLWKLCLTWTQREEILWA